VSFPALIKPGHAPPGAVYAVVFFDHDNIAWTTNVHDVIVVMQKFDIVFRCSVVRVEDNRAVWPWFVQGGSS
jgi:hypothetical protein